jgi:hypothetical protein
MDIAPVARFAVPAGTAAAIVVAREATGDETTDSRRFAAIASLDDARFRGSFEELIVAGVYTVLSERVLVLRVSAGGVRTFAALVAIAGATPVPTPSRAGLDIELQPLALAPDAAGTAAFRALLESEAKQRPVFHGTTAEGTTYSGFEAQATAEILTAIRGTILGATAPKTHPTPRPSPLSLIFAGAAIDIPPGLIVGLRQASI